MRQNTTGMGPGLEGEMEKINDGGQAFPLLSKWDDQKLNGMTLRDYFAAKAIQAFISSHLFSPASSPYNIALDAYMMADAMLKAREAR